MSWKPVSTACFAACCVRFACSQTTSSATLCRIRSRTCSDVSRSGLKIAGANCARDVSNVVGLLWSSEENTRCRVRICSCWILPARLKSRGCTRCRVINCNLTKCVPGCQYARRAEIWPSCTDFALDYQCLRITQERKIWLTTGLSEAFLRVAQKESRGCAAILFIRRILGRKTYGRQWMIEVSVFRGTESSMKKNVPAFPSCHPNVANSDDVV